MTDPERLRAFERDPTVVEFFRLITAKARDAGFVAGVYWSKLKPNADRMTHIIEGELAEEEAAYGSVLNDAEDGSKSESEAVRLISARLHTQIKAMSPPELSNHLRGTSGRVPYTSVETELREQLPRFSPDDVAETLVEANSAEFGALVTGIQRVQEALPGSYLFVLWTTRLTNDSCCAQIVRMTPFLTIHSAQEWATASLNEWIAAGGQTEPAESGYRPQISVSRVPTVSYASVRYDSQRLRNSTQVTAIVLGPFPTAIVGFELINAFSAPVEREALRNFFLAVSDNSYSNIETSICYAKDDPRRDILAVRRGGQWCEHRLGDTLPENRSTMAGDSDPGLTPPSAVVPMRVITRREAHISPQSRQTAHAAQRFSAWLKAQIHWNTGRASENDQLAWFENTRITRLEGDETIRWTDVERVPATTESNSPEAND